MSRPCATVARRWVLRRRLAAQHPIAALCEPADQPIRLDRVVHPRRRPPLGDAGFDRLPRHFAAVAIEQRELPAGLRQPALEITPLRLGRASGRRRATRRRVDAAAFLFVRSLTHARPPLTMIKET